MVDPLVRRDQLSAPVGATSVEEPLVLIKSEFASGVRFQEVGGV